MQKWDYAFMSISYDTKIKLFTTAESNPTTGESIGEILRIFGSKGWELVNMWPRSHDATNWEYLGGGNIEALKAVTQWFENLNYAVVFKRPI